MSEDLIIVEWDKLPQDVKAILQSKDENKDGYKELARIKGELNAIGWVIDYFLDEEITELRPMTKEEN